MTSFAEAFIRLRVDPSMLRKEIAQSVESAGSKAQGERAGTSWAAGFGSKITSVAGKINKVAGLGVAGVAIEGVKMATTFNAKMELLATQAGVAQNKIGFLSKGVLQLAGQVGFAPDSLAESLFHIESNFASLGITGPKALNLVKVAAKGAAVGHADLVDVTNALGAAEASGIKGVENFTQAMGILNSVVGSGDMHMQDLAEAFGTGVLASVKEFGVSIRDVGAALAVYGDNNIRGAHAGTQLRMAVMALAAPTKAGVKLLESIGIASGRLAEDMRKGGLKLALEDLVTHMHKAGLTSDQTGQIITEAFGKKAGVGLSILAGQMTRFESKYPALAKGASDFGTAWTRTQQTTQQQWKQTTAAADAFLIQVGQRLLPVATKLLSFASSHAGLLLKLTGATVGLSAAVTVGSKAWALYTTVTALCTKAALGTRLQLIGLQIQTVAVSASQKAAAAAQGIWTGALTAGTAVINAVKDAQIGMRIAMVALVAQQYVVAAASKIAAAAQWLWNIAMDANPIGIVIVAIGALVGAVVYAYTHFSWFRRIVQDVWGWIKDNWPLLAGILTLGIAPFIAFVVQHWGEITSAVSASIKWIRHEFADFVGFLFGIWADILHGAAGAFGWIPGIGPKLKAATAAFDRFRQNVTDAIAGIQGRQVAVGVNLLLSGPGHVKAFAGGGLVSGPGTGTSDTAGIFALSNKEYVHNAAAVAYYGTAFMDAVNRREIPKMAQGGIPGAGLSVAAHVPSKPAIQAAVWPSVDHLIAIALQQMKAGGKFNPLTGLAIAAMAQSFVGKVPYVWGGTSALTGWDCSGMVLNILQRFGFAPPRTAAQQQAWAQATATPVTGGLAFFIGADGTAKSAGHVGIVVGPGVMANAFGTGFGTIDSSFASGGGTLGFGIPPGGSYRHGGVLTEPIAGIGLKSGRSYAFHAPEIVTSERGLAMLAGLLSELIAAVDQNSYDTGQEVAAALGGAASRAAHRMTYSPRS